MLVNVPFWPEFLTYYRADNTRVSCNPACSASGRRKRSGEQFQLQGFSRYLLHALENEIRTYRSDINTMFRWSINFGKTICTHCVSTVSVYIPYDGTATGLEAYRAASLELISIFESLASQPAINVIEVPIRVKCFFHNFSYCNVYKSNVVTYLKCMIFTEN